MTEITRSVQAPRKEWQAFTSKYISATEYANSVASYAFGAAATMVQVLKQCGDDLSRDNIMRQAANLKNFHAPLLAPGVAIDTLPTNYSPIRQLQLRQFDGESWVPIGDLISD
jgi:branched-chain amino acid transport system substrate-binding protein